MDFLEESAQELLVQLIVIYVVPYVIRWIVRGRNIKKILLKYNITQKQFGNCSQQFLFYTQNNSIGRW
jgi:hypothetical protein